MRYILGINDDEIVAMPRRCIFKEHEEMVEVSIFREEHHCKCCDIGTKEYLMNKYKKLTLLNFKL